MSVSPTSGMESPICNAIKGVADIGDALSESRAVCASEFRDAVCAHGTSGSTSSAPAARRVFDLLLVVT